MKAYELELQQIFTFKTLTPAPLAKYSLKKLPLWGMQAPAHELSFEWPTQDMFGQMQPDVKIKSLTFKSYRSGRISSVQCALTNGQSSQVFEKPGRGHGD